LASEDNPQTFTETFENLFDSQSLRMLEMSIFAPFIDG
jgi:hypothetical protein